MYDVLECLLAFIEPLAKQWDTHQIRLEDVTGRLLDMMHECRRPHDLENEVIDTSDYDNEKLIFVCRKS